MKLVSCKEVKTRKKHQCCGCLKEIPKGTQAIKEDIAKDGGIYTAYICPVCERVLQESNCDVFEEGEIGDTDEYKDIMKEIQGGRE